MLFQIGSSLVNGLTIAAALFLSAAGLTILFGILRILNFAHGAFIMVGAYVAAMMLSHATGFGPAWFILTAFVAGLAVAVVGLVVDKLVFRRLSHVDESNVLIATFALMLVVQGVAKLIWGADFVSINPPAGMEGAIIAGRLIIPQFSLFMIIVGFVVFVVLEFIASRLWIGKVLESVAKDSWVMALLGHDVKKVTLIAVMLSFFLAGFAGGILAPNQTLQPTLGDSFILHAFAVVIIGGLGSIRGAFIASLLLGLAESLGSTLMPSLSLYIGIIVILLIRPQGLIATAAVPPSRSLAWIVDFSARPKVPQAPSESGRLGAFFKAERFALAAPALALAPGPSHRGLYFGIAAIGLLGLISVPWFGGGITYIASFVLIEAVFALSWNLLFGYAGLAVFGHAAFFAIGSYLMAYVLKGDPQAPFLLVLIAAGILGSAVAAPIGAIALRRSGGLQLAILTLALSEVLRVLVSYSAPLGRDDGLSAIPRPILQFGSVIISLASDTSYFWFLCVICCGLIALMWCISHSEFGRTLYCIHQDSERASFIGINIDKYRFLAFVIASGIAAVAGALAAPLTQIVTPETAGVARSTAPMLNTLLGGSGVFGGPVVGAVAFAAVQFATRTFEGLSELIMGAILLTVILIAPSGIAGFFYSLLPGALGAFRSRTREKWRPRSDVST